MENNIFDPDKKVRLFVKDCGNGESGSFHSYYHSFGLSAHLCFENDLFKYIIWWHFLMKIKLSSIEHRFLTKILMYIDLQLHFNY